MNLTFTVEANSKMHDASNAALADGKRRRSGYGIGIVSFVQNCTFE